MSRTKHRKILNAMQKILRLCERMWKNQIIFDFKMSEKFKIAISRDFDKNVNTHNSKVIRKKYYKKNMKFLMISQ